MPLSQRRLVDKHRLLSTSRSFVSHSLHQATILWLVSFCAPPVAAGRRAIVSLAMLGLLAFARGHRVLDSPRRPPVVEARAP